MISSSRLDSSKKGLALALALISCGRSQEYSVSVHTASSARPSSSQAAVHERDDRGSAGSHYL